MNLARVIERHAQFQPAKVALRFHGREVSYAALWARIEAASAGLAARLDIKRGDRVAYLGYNDPEMLVLLFALARLGAIFVPLNFRLAPPEHVSILAHAEVGTLIVDTDFLPSVHAARSQLPALRCIGLHASLDVGPSWAEVSATGATALVEEAQARDPVMLVYTSGTTGRPKGVLHTQEGMIWNCVIGTHYQDLTVHDHVLSALPMFHVGGLCIQTMPALHAGATVTFHARFDPGRWLDDVAASRPTLSLLVPATMKAVIDHPRWATAELTSLRMVNTGSSVVPEALIKRFLDRGVIVAQVYGSTETGPISIYQRIEDAARTVGSAGKAGLHVDVRLVDQEGHDVPHGAIGEIWIKAPNVMQSYWRDPTNPAFQEGWFHSGDLARIDEDGCYRVVGRSKDMIISGGENIYPVEIENILAESADVLDAAVVGQPDERWGEVAVAAIVRRSGAVLDEAGVRRLFEGRIARYKHPRRIVFVESLPKTALGKVQKSELAQQLGQRTVKGE